MRSDPLNDGDTGGKFDVGHGRCRRQKCSGRAADGHFAGQSRTLASEVSAVQLAERLIVMPAPIVSAASVVPPRLLASTIPPVVNRACQRGTALLHRRRINAESTRWNPPASDRNHSGASSPDGLPSLLQPATTRASTH